MLFICISYNGDQGDELLIDSVKYKVTSQKRVKKVLKYSTSESFLYDILKGAITSIPRWGLMQFLEKNPGRRYAVNTMFFVRPMGPLVTSK